MSNNKDNSNNINPEDNENENLDKYNGMTPEEWYHSTEPDVHDGQHLPSTFMSDEQDHQDEINMVFIPKYKPNIPLIIAAHCEEASQAKTYDELFAIMANLFEQGEIHGAKMERRDRLMEELELNDLIEGVESGKYEIVYPTDDGEYED